MPKKPFNWRMWTKVAIAGVTFGVGGPMLTAYVTPTEEEIRKRYNPDLRRRSEENRAQREQEFDDFVTKLKEYSKSDKPIWVVAKEAREREDREREEKRRKDIRDSAKAKEQELEARREEMRKETGLSR
ncbi:unnamed protein product [Clonostachys rosea f. rosea IK726]|uniref:Cytochrome b mRNA-processing protein 4 n=3 Tax=Clonostachys TaxID=110564 RepID=A0A0B7K2C0_BIOOC|nr:unnamed protein product [Clonostachys rosea f. rosea IK726]CAH0017790.1 unnamed protein product [Clonostachys rhizophaga]